MNTQNVSGSEFDIIVIRLIIIFGFKEKRRVDFGEKLIGHFLKVGKELLGIFGVVCNVVFLYKLLKHRKCQVTRNI